MAINHSIVRIVLQLDSLFRGLSNLQAYSENDEQVTEFHGDGTYEYGVNPDNPDIAFILHAYSNTGAVLTYESGGNYFANDIAAYDALIESNPKTTIQRPQKWMMAANYFLQVTLEASPDTAESVLDPDFDVIVPTVSSIVSQIYVTNNGLDEDASNITTLIAIEQPHENDICIVKIITKAIASGGLAELVLRISDTNIYHTGEIISSNDQTIDLLLDNSTVAVEGGVRQWDISLRQLTSTNVHLQFTTVEREIIRFHANFEAVTDWLSFGTLLNVSGAGTDWQANLARQLQISLYSEIQMDIAGTGDLRNIVSIFLPAENLPYKESDTVEEEKVYTIGTLNQFPSLIRRASSDLQARFDKFATFSFRQGDSPGLVGSVVGEVVNNLLPGKDIRLKIYAKRK